MAAAVDPDPQPQPTRRCLTPPRRPPGPSTPTSGKAGQTSDSGTPQSTRPMIKSNQDHSCSCSADRGLAGRGDHEAARDHYLRARAAYRRLGRRREAAEVTVNLGNAAAADGDLAAARRFHRRAIRDFRELGVWPSLGRAVHNLGLTYSPASAARGERVLPAWLALDAVHFTLASRPRDPLLVPAAAAFVARGHAQPCSASSSGPWRAARTAARSPVGSEPVVQDAGCSTSKVSFPSLRLAAPPTRRRK